MTSRTEFSVQRASEFCVYAILASLSLIELKNTLTKLKRYLNHLAGVSLYKLADLITFGKARLGSNSISLGCFPFVQLEPNIACAFLKVLSLSHTHKNINTHCI